MNKALKKKWVAALRSGKYRQGRARLCTPAKHGGHVKYCCLGVLCEISKAEKIWRDAYGYLGSDSYVFVPDRLAEEIDLQNNDQIDLAAMNDDGKSFREIANWIEENL